MLSIHPDVFFLGAVGAVAPEIVRLWNLKHDKSQFAWSGRYVVASILMCGLGGIVALCLEPDTAWKALYGGVTTPTLISAAGRLKRPGKKFKNQGPNAPAAVPVGWRAFFYAL